MGNLETFCFHAQQAAEKSIKPVLVQERIAFPYTHDLARLVSMVKSAGLPWPQGLDEAIALSDYVAAAR